MCHLIFLLPLAGLPLFWLLPLGYALPINLVIWLTSALLYWLIRRAMRKPPADDGFQGRAGTQTEDLPIAMKPSIVGGERQ